jgi:hypothetical protein
MQTVFRDSLGRFAKRPTVIYPTFGIEMEMDYVLPVVPDGWSAGRDGSLRQRSTVAKLPSSLTINGRKYDGGAKRGTKELRSKVIVGTDDFMSFLLDSLNWADRKTNVSCGMHVHLGFTDTTNIRPNFGQRQFESHIHLGKLALVHPPLFDSIVEADVAVRRLTDGHDPSRVNSQYARPNKHGVIGCRGWWPVSASYMHDPVTKRIVYKNVPLHPKMDMRKTTNANGYFSAVFRPWGTVEFRYPTPRVDREALGALLCASADTIGAHIPEALEVYNNK